jgi:hypothetical protein|tara:strand:- start:50 stop:214 length:165 start_codon:yes stop_codon:yes gene_type:complete
MDMKWYLGPLALVMKVVQQGSMADELKKLSELKDSGILTEAEFEEQKAKLLEAD